MQSIRPTLRAVLCAALLVLLSGCASFVEYHKELYRVIGTGIAAGYYTVAGLIIDMQKDLGARKNYEAAHQISELSEVEKMLDDACLPLHSVNPLKTISDEVDGNLKEEAYRAYGPCEEATLNAKEELYRIAPGLATKHRRRP